MNESSYQSPISPGRSWYEDSCGSRPVYPKLESSQHCDVLIIGGGFCGLSAALRLAQSGTDVVLIDANRFGDGASGRNGGQMGAGQRAGVLELEKELGFERSKALWDMAEDARQSLLNTAEQNQFECDYQPGQLTPMHKRRYEKEAQEEVELLQERYSYGSVEYVDQQTMADKLGSDHYFGGITDSAAGHIHPLKYLIGLAKSAQVAGAQIHENTAAVSIENTGKISVKTSSGEITANQCILALNGHHADIRPELASHVMPIQSFIGATIPLPSDTKVLPNKEAVDDSRFVVRYFRKSKDNRLLFGGREAYGKSTPGDIERAVQKQITEIYPELETIEITHAWGGNVAITMPRMPYVRELKHGLWTAGGFSGHGVMMANYCGKMLAEKILGKSEQIQRLQELKIPPFPGGTLLRNPLKILALTWYSLLDRI